MANNISQIDLLEYAWGIIAAVGYGDWAGQSEEWQEVAARWRDDYNAEIKRHHAEIKLPE